MQIIVKTFFGGREIPCTVEAWDTVDHVKAVVQDNAGIPTDEQQLFWGGVAAGWQPHVGRLRHPA